jgi:heme-degrading monooxygenase HmoA
VFARVSTYKAGDTDRLLDGFNMVTAELERIEGFSHAYFLVDRAAGKALSVTIWETEEAMTESSRQADELRKRGTEQGRGSVESVDQYEIGLTAGTPSTVA